LRQLAFEYQANGDPVASKKLDEAAKGPFMVQIFLGEKGIHPRLLK
jgi:hypothetical protein